jgi:hypothetical protein
MHETLWPGEFVTDSAVTRCISEARRAVGDTGDEQRVIRTLHGRGYRFVADVTGETIEQAPVAPAAGPQPAATGNVGVLRSDPVSNPVHRRTSRALLSAALALGFVAALLAWQRIAPATTSPARRTIAIVPTLDTVSDSDLQVLALSVADLLDKRLSRVPGLVVRSPDYGAIGRGTRDVPPPAGATHLLEAAISRSADRLKGHLVVTLREPGAEASSLSTPIGIYDLPFLGPGTDLTTFTRVRDAIVSRLVGVLLPAIDLPGGDSVRPRDPRAFRLYLLAASGDCADGHLRSSGARTRQAIARAGPRLRPELGAARVGARQPGDDVRAERLTLRGGAQRGGTRH